MLSSLSTHTAYVINGQIRTRCHSGELIALRAQARIRIRSHSSLLHIHGKVDICRLKVNLFTRFNHTSLFSDMLDIFSMDLIYFSVANCLISKTKGDYSLGGGLAEQSQHTDFGSQKSDSKTKLHN